MSSLFADRRFCVQAQRFRGKKEYQNVFQKYFENIEKHICQKKLLSEHLIDDSFGKRSRTV